MSKNKLLLVIIAVALSAAAIAACSQSDQTPVATPESSYPTKELSEDARECVTCHATETHGIVEDWSRSAHAKVGVSCLDCHKVDANSPMAVKRAVRGHEDLTVTISVLVSPQRCGECHQKELAEFDASGHYRAALQVEDKASMQTLIHHHEGRDYDDISGVSEETGCAQCHGIRVQVDENGEPDPHTWPAAGIGNIYPDGSVGNCTVCHTRHRFDIAEARHPESCGTCHLGPDHPDIEIYENSKHGQIYAAEGEAWSWNNPPNEWEPGDYRAPTCATCHMSGIGNLQVTHNISQRLHWNLWAKRSAPRNSDDPMSALTGHAEEGRAEMEQVCTQCHSAPHTEGFFASGDDAVRLYNEAYYDPAKKMLDDLQAAGLLKDNPWEDEFQKLYYHLWHHEGRRARQGALMGGPDWAHWHGFFILQQDLYRMQDIYDYRMEHHEIEQP
ncbi:MAG: beta-ketoacyl-ACP synthase [Anaerolineae bacterium]|nr:beta-ketoacyl-ACP synthase [Anaerolineae bacterium]